MKRTYENGSIRVFWDSSLCIHSGMCLSADGAIFDAGRRPWVKLDAGTTESTVAAVELCPSGALRYERLDGGPQEQTSVTVTVVPWPNGPLFVRGQVEVKDARGELFDVGPRFALCRCGHSRNHPFCDLSHQEAGFRSYPRAESDERRTAQSPDDVSKELLS
jgi:uncharacterized Fe-S cluster protein YjdI